MIGNYLKRVPSKVIRHVSLRHSVTRITDDFIGWEFVFGDCNAPTHFLSLEGHTLYVAL